MRTAYLGTSEFAATVLARLAGSRHSPALVVTPPDSRRGRGRKLAPPPAAAAARDLGLELLQTQDVNEDESRERIRAAAPETVAVCAFGQIIRAPLLSDFQMLNVHPSLLPRWRGAAPIERAIMAGDERTGVTIMRVTEGLDSGPIAMQEQTGISPGEQFASIEGRLAELGGEMLVAALDALGDGRLVFSDQDDDDATYAEKIEQEDRRLDPARRAPELERTVRALGRSVGTYLELEGGERLGVREARALRAGPAQGQIEAAEGRLVLGSAEGGLGLEVVQPPGKREMGAKEFLHGHPAPARAL
ncbi:MAG: methionyl-tRNA formyltransferase [Solirubrobacterales bacterium]